MRAGTGITRQYDSKLIYVRKSMPRWKRRRWTSFVKKVGAVASRGEGTRTVVFKPPIFSDFTLSQNLQMRQTFGLYTCRSTVSFLDHIHRIAKLENTGDQTSFQGGTVYPSTKYKFRSGVADFTFTNRSTLNDEPSAITDEPANFCPLEIDLYEIVARKDASYVFAGNPTELENLTGMIEYKGRRLIDNETPYPALSATDTSMIQRGMTPFEFTEGLSYFGIKVLKKTKHFLKVGDYFTYQMRDARNHVMTKEKMEAKLGCNYPGKTKFLYMVVKPVAGAVNLGPSIGQITPRIFVGHTYKYTYKIEGETDDRILVITD
jgi:hypothetical protein